MVQRTRERKVAKLFQHGGSQAVQLPAGYRFDTDEVYVTRDDATGDVTLSSRPGRNVWRAYFEFRDSLDIPQEDLDAYMSERPMNQPVNRPSVFAASIDERIGHLEPQEYAISVITRAELMFGLRGVPDEHPSRLMVRSFLGEIQTLD